MSPAFNLKEKRTFRNTLLGVGVSGVLGVMFYDGSERQIKPLRVPGEAAWFQPRAIGLDGSANEIGFITYSFEEALAIDCGGIEHPIFPDDNNNKRLIKLGEKIIAICELSDQYPQPPPIIHEQALPVDRA